VPPKHHRAPAAHHFGHNGSTAARPKLTRYASTWPPHRPKNVATAAIDNKAEPVGSVVVAKLAIEPRAPVRPAARRAAFVDSTAVAFVRACRVGGLADGVDS